MTFEPLSVILEVDIDPSRRVELTLERLQGDSELWKIGFELWDIVSDPASNHLMASISLDVPPEDTVGARTIAYSGELCTGQRAQAIVAASVVEDSVKGEATFDDVRDAVLEIVRVD